MKSNTILASLVISSVVAATTAVELDWETTYARYHRNLSKAGKGESSIGSKSTKSPTVITSSGSKSSKGSGSKSSKSSGQTLEVSNYMYAS